MPTVKVHKVTEYSTHCTIMSSEHILTSFKNGVRTIKFNRPEKKNAMNRAMYKQIADILNSDAKNDEIVVTIITGIGEYFTSGNDISSAIQDAQGSEDVGLTAVKNMILAFVNYPKILIAMVNGPAIGIGATFPAICDIVYATDRASFDTPFVKLGLCAEGASSFTYPITLGRSKASELILLNQKLTAQEAYSFGLVSKVIPYDALNDFIEDLHKFGKLPVNSVKRNKELIMDNFHKTYVSSIDREMDMLRICGESEEFSNAVIAFMNRRSKL